MKLAYGGEEESGIIWQRISEENENNQLNGGAAAHENNIRRKLAIGISEKRNGSQQNGEAINPWPINKNGGSSWRRKWRRKCGEMAKA